MAGAEQIAQLAVQLVLQDEDFKKKLLAAEGSTKSAGANFAKMGKKLDKFVTGAFKAAGVAMVGFVAASAKVGSSFEYEMRKVSSIAIDGNQNLGALTDKARELGATTSFTATQAAEAMVNFARAGMSSNDILMATTPALLLAESSAASMDLATSSLAATMKQFSMDTLQSARAADTLSMTTRVSMFDLQGLTDAMKYGGSVGAAFGMTLEETTAALAQFRNLGLEASMAGMNFRMSMAQAAKATPKAKKALAELGLTADDINPQMHGFGEILKRVGEAGIDTAGAMTIFGRRAGANVAVLAKQMSDGTSSYEKDLAAIRGAQGSVMELWEQMTDTVQYQATVSKSAFQELMLTVFDSYSGPLKEMFRELTNTINFVTDVFSLSDSATTGFSGTLTNITEYLKNNREAIAIGFIRILTAMNELIEKSIAWIPWLGTIARWMTAIFVAAKVYAFVTAIQKAIITFKALQVAIGATTLSIRALAVSMGPIAIALAAAGAAMVYLSSSTDDAADATQRLIKERQELAKKVTAANKTREREAGKLLKNTQKEIVAQKDVSTATGEYSEALKTQNDRIMNMTAAEAASAIQKGEMVELDGELFTIQSAILDLGLETANDKIAESVKNLRDKEAGLLDEIQGLRDANQYYLQQKKDLNETEGDHSEALAELNGWMRGNQLKMKGLKSEAGRLNSQYVGLSQTTTRLIDDFIRLEKTQAGMAGGDGSGSSGRGGESRSEKRRKAEAKITEYVEKEAQRREFFGREELLKFVQNAQKQIEEAEKVYDKRIELARRSSDKAKWQAEKETAIAQNLTTQKKELEAEWQTILKESAVSNDAINKMSRVEFEKHLQEQGDASKEYFNQQQQLLKLQHEQGLLDEAAYRQALDKNIGEYTKRYSEHINFCMRLNKQRAEYDIALIKEELGKEWILREEYEKRLRAASLKYSATRMKIKARHWARTVDGWVQQAAVFSAFQVKKVLAAKKFERERAKLLTDFNNVNLEMEKELQAARERGGYDVEEKLRLIRKKYQKQRVDSVSSTIEAIGQREIGFIGKFTLPRLRKIEDLEAAKNDALEQMSEASETERAEVAKKFDEQIAAQRKEGWQKFVDAGKFAFSQVKAASTAAFKAMKKGLESVGDVFNTITGGFGEMGLDNMLDQAQSKAEETDEEGNLINADKSTGELVAEAMNEAFDNMIERIGNIIEALPAMITTFINRLPELIQKFVEGLPQMVEAVANNLEPLIQTIVEAIPRVIRAVADMFTELVDAFATHFPTIVEELALALPPLFDAVISALPRIVSALMSALPNVVAMVSKLIEQVIREIPEIVGVLVELLPAVIDSVIKGLDSIILAIFEVIPLIMEKVIMGLPAILMALMDGVMTIITTLVEEIPRLLAMILNQLPILVLKLIQAVTVMIDVVIRAIPDIITGFIEALPELIFALVAALPGIAWALIVGVIELVPQLVMSLLDEFVGKLPELVIKIIVALVKGIAKAAADFAKIFTKIFKEAFSVIKNPFKKDKSGKNWFQRTGSGIKKQWNKLFGYSGVDYVPATMRMTVHKGEAVIPAHRNPMMGNDSAGIPNPPMAGSGGGGGGYSVPPIDISVMAEGRVLDKVQVAALRRGHAPEMQELLRRASGVKVGFNKGKFNRFG